MPDFIELTQEQLQELLRFAHLIAEDWWVAAEMYQQCFFCGEWNPGEDEHDETCPVLAAKRLLQQIHEKVGWIGCTSGVRRGILEVVKKTFALAILEYPRA